MKVYLDVIFIINYIYDFIILLSSSIILKRRVNMFRLLIGSLFGSLTMFLLFIRLNLILFKLLVSIIIILITFGYKDIRYFISNLYYFYLISIILGGFIYMINNSYKLNILLGIVLSIIVIRVFIKNNKKYKLTYSRYMKVIIYFNDYKVNLNGYVDTGNKLKDPYSFKPIVLVDNRFIKSIDKYIYVPFRSCNNEGLLKCIKPKSIFIEGIGYRKNLLVGLTDSIKIDGVNCLLNELIMEG